MKVNNEYLIQVYVTTLKERKFYYTNQILTKNILCETTNNQLYISE